MRHAFYSSIALLCALVLVAVPSPLAAQQISIENIDARNFPTVTGSLLLFDPSGNPLFPIEVEDIRLEEEGQQRTITAISCPPQGDPTPIDIVFLIDKSGSMAAELPYGGTAIAMVRQGIDRFFESYLFVDPAGVALVGFDNLPFLFSDFRTTAAPLQTALAGLVPGGGTIFDPPLLDPVIGGVSLLAGRPDSVRRMIIFITDGRPAHGVAVNDAVDAAQAAGVEVHAITISNNADLGLVSIAERTGGSSHEKVDSPAELTALLRSLAVASRGIEPCRITWESDGTCASKSARRNVDVTHILSSGRGTGSYILPVDGQQRLDVSSRILYFGSVDFPNRSEREVTLTAQGASFTITGAEITDPDHFEVISWGESAPPFILDDGESRRVRLAYVPGDSLSYGAECRFVGDPCPSRHILLAGRTSGDTTGPTPLELVRPVGGESFVSCDSIEITWTGVTPQDSIRIEYSDDGGTTWKIVADRATGLTHTWQPPGPSDRYRIRISTDAAEQHLIATAAGGGQLDADTIFATQAALAIPLGLEILNDSLYIVENGAPSIRLVDFRTNVITRYAGTGNTGNFGDGGPARLARMNAPTGIYASGDSLFILEYSKIRIVDRNDERIWRYGGNALQTFTEDGASLDDALTSLNDPVSMIEDDGAYYISERLSHRIRRIDKQTKVLTTIAGGGGNLGFDSDGRPATDAQLLLPRGLAIRDSLLFLAEETGHRVRIVNLRTGIISSIAGNGSRGFSGDGGPGTSAELASPTDIALWGDSLFIAEKFGHRIRLVDLRTGMISTFAGTGVNDVSGDGGPARFAAVGEPISLKVVGDELYFTDRSSGRVRRITLYRPDGLDSTTNDIVVAAPEATLTTTSVRFGDVVRGGRIDSLLAGIYCNAGTLPLIVDSVSVTGPHSDEFSIDGALSNTPLPPGSCRSFTIGFSPGDIGERTASLVIFGSCGPPDTLDLIGIGVENCNVRKIRSIDFGALVADVASSTPTRDSIIVELLCNDGATAIQGNLSLFSPDGSFSIIDGEGPFTLQPGSCLRATIRFAPEQRGRSSARLSYGLPVNSCAIGPTLLIGERRVPPTAETEAALDIGTVCPDDLRDTAITLRNRGELPLEVFDLRFEGPANGFSLIDAPPSPGAPIMIAPDDSTTIGLRFAPSSAGGKSARLRISSNDPTSPLFVDIAGEGDSVRVVSVVSTIAVIRDASATYPRDTTFLLENSGSRPVTIIGLAFTGADPGSFAFDASLFPITIAPGERIGIPVSILEPTEDRPYSATILPQITTPCPTPAIEVRIVHSGSAPLVRVEDLALGSLDCDAETRIDSLLALFNDGGSPLEISAMTIIDGDSSLFSLDATLPILIEPGDSSSIPIGYIPNGTGDHEVRLQLTTNAGVLEIIVRGQRNQVSFDLDPATLLFDPSLAGPNDREIRVRNTGTVRLTWAIPPTVGDFRVVSVTPSQADPGESSVVVIRYEGPVEGTIPTALTISELLCGTGDEVDLRADDAPGKIALYLPDDTVDQTDEVQLPLRYRLIDGIAPKEGDTLLVTIRFVGTTFLFAAIDRGEILERTFDQRSASTTLEIALPFKVVTGDTLVRLEGLGMIGLSSFTPLEILAASWSRPSIATETTDGSLTVLGDCRDPGLHIEVRPPAIRLVTPQPATESVTITVALADWSSLAFHIVDAEGRVVAAQSEGFVPSGLTELTMPVDRYPAGLYRIVVRSPHGSDSAPLVIRP